MEQWLFISQSKLKTSIVENETTRGYLRMRHVEQLVETLPFGLIKSRAVHVLERDSPI